MKTYTIHTFTFDELSKEAKEKAIEEVRGIETEAGNPYESEMQKTWDELERLFNVRATTDGYGHALINFDKWNNGATDLCGVRAMAYAWNNFERGIAKGKYYSTSGKWINGKYTYKCRHSKCTFEYSCNLTGVCYDMDALDPIEHFLHGKVRGSEFKYTSVRDLVEECFHNLLKVEEKENEYRLSDEGIKELIEANEWEFTESGQLWNESSAA